MTIKEPEIKQYKNVADHVAAVGMDAYLRDGDWMLLVTLRDVLSEIDFDEYEDQDYKELLQQELEKADSLIIKNMNKDQLAKLVDLNPDLPIKDWFG
ncbi:MAG: hypothetical protein RIC57_09155 [Balneola sp.]